VLGFTDSLSSLASYAKPELLSIEAAINAKNAEGGIDGHKIKLLSADSGEVGSGEAAANVIKFQSEGASAVLGMIISNDCHATVPTAERKKIPILCWDTGTEELQPPNEFVYNTSGLEAQEAQMTVEFMDTKVHKSGKKVMAIVTNQNIGSEFWAEVMKEKAEADGWTVPGVETMSESATTIGPEASQVISQHPDAVAAELFAQFNEPLAQALKGAGMEPPIMGTHGTPEYNVLKNSDYPFYTPMIATPLQPEAPGQTPQTEALIAAYKKMGLSTAEQMNQGNQSNNLPAPYIALAGLEKCGYPCPSEKMAETLNDLGPVEVPGILGKGQWEITPTDHAGLKYSDVYAWDSQKNYLVPEAKELKQTPVTELPGL